MGKVPAAELEVRRKTVLKTLLELVDEIPIPPHETLIARETRLRGYDTAIIPRHVRDALDHYAEQGIVVHRDIHAYGRVAHVYSILNREKAKEELEKNYLSSSGS